MPITCIICGDGIPERAATCTACETPYHEACAAWMQVCFAPRCTGREFRSWPAAAPVSRLGLVALVLAGGLALAAGAQYLGASGLAARPVVGSPVIVPGARL